MRAAHQFLVVTLGLVLLATGTLPPEHLHHPTATRPQIVHSHFETVRFGEDLRQTVFGADDDDHQTAVGIERVMAGGPSSRSAHQPALPPTPVRMSASQSVVTVLGPWEPAETPSPPPRPSAPRAPPA